MKKSLILAAMFAAAAMTIVPASANPPMGNVLNGSSSVKGGGFTSNANAGKNTTKGLGLRMPLAHNTVPLKSTSKLGISPPPDGPMKAFFNYSTGTGNVIYRKYLDATWQEGWGGLIADAKASSI